MPQSQKDFSSVSPSAKSVLLAKSYTDIPFAREVAAQMDRTEVFDLSFDENDFWFLARVLHFELRYKSIDQLLAQTDAPNVLELASGFSFRGLDLCRKRPELHFIDSDLPENIALKRQLLARLEQEQDNKGYELQELNVLDEAGFRQLTERFGPGPLCILNEGLMMYLNQEEKRKLCRIIHAVLQERDGCWINADICVRQTGAMPGMKMQTSKAEQQFFAQHQIEENKFESFDAALDFMEQQGFGRVKEASIEYASLSIMPRLMQVIPEAMRQRNEPPPRLQATWMLCAR